MATDETGDRVERPPRSPAPPLTAAAALETIREALRSAQPPAQTPPQAPAQAPPQGSQDGLEGKTEGSTEGDLAPGALSSAERALASLLLLREVREQLAGWETGLVEEARTAGASWADLAHPLGVASRQAAERRYLRQRPGPAGSTGEQRVQATRDRRAADRSVGAWAQVHAADLRRLAGQISALGDLPRGAGAPLGRLDEALAASDPTRLLDPLTALHPYLHRAHTDLAEQVADLTGRTDRLRRDSDAQRRAP